MSRDRGAASILVAALGLVLVMAGVAGAMVGAARAGRHRAQVAADLGALAGAGRAIEGRDAACARAERFVAANGGRLTSCVLSGLEVTVRVEVVVNLGPHRTGSGTAAARAGPA